MNRRTLMGGGAALSALPGTVLAASAPTNASLTAAHAAYTTTRATMEAYVETGFDDPVYARLFNDWIDAFERVRDCQAATVADLIAKARIAKREFATNADGSEDEPNGLGEDMARAVINDLLRLAGAGA